MLNARLFGRGRAWSLVTLLALAAILIGACGAPPAAAPGGEATSAPAAGGGQAAEKTLVVAVDGDIDTFDPCCTVGSKPSQTTIQNTFDQLTQYAQVERTLPNGQTYKTVDTSNIIGMLAESWEMTPDGTISFKLRDGLKWHNGEPITAQGVADGYGRTYEVGGVSSFLLAMGGVSSPSQITASDPKTVVMKPTVANTLVSMNNVMHNTSALSPKDITERGGENLGAEFFKKNLAVGNGPYELESYTPGDSIVLRARADYYGGKAPIDRVIMKIVPDAQQRVLLLKSGEVDMILVPPVKDLADLESDPNVRVISVPSTQNRMLLMNLKVAPFDKLEVRQAFAHAIPYDTLIKDVWYGRAQPLKSPIATGTPTSDFSYWKYDYNLDKARELLAAAGFPNGEGLPELKLSIRIGTEEDERAAVIIQDSLSQIGVKVTIDKLAFATFNEQVQGRKLQIWIDEWISWVNDPYYHLSWIYKSDSPTVYTNYNNPEVDELITKYTLWNGDAAEREQASKRIQELIVGDVPIIYLAAPNFNIATRANVTGYVYYNDELTRFYYMDKTP
jgi:peptide/nickel transport system substrate-binding protein